MAESWLPPQSPVMGQTPGSAGSHLVEWSELMTACAPEDMGTSAFISTATKCIQSCADAVHIYLYHHLTAMSLHTSGMNIGKRGPRSPWSHSECHKKFLILSLPLPCKILADTLEALPPRCSWGGSLVIPSHFPSSSRSPQPYLNTPRAHFRTRTRQRAHV